MTGLVLRILFNNSFNKRSAEDDATITVPRADSGTTATDSGDDDHDDDDVENDG